jgi:hypothetical protein
MMSPWRPGRRNKLGQQPGKKQPQAGLSRQRLAKDAKPTKPATSSPFQSTPSTLLTPTSGAKSGTKFATNRRHDDFLTVGGINVVAIYMLCYKAVI